MAGDQQPTTTYTLLGARKSIKVSFPTELLLLFLSSDVGTRDGIGMGTFCDGTFMAPDAVRSFGWRTGTTESPFEQWE